MTEVWVLRTVCDVAIAAATVCALRLFAVVASLELRYGLWSIRKEASGVIAEGHYLASLLGATPVLGTIGEVQVAITSIGVVIR